MSDESKPKLKRTISPELKSSWHRFNVLKKEINQLITSSYKYSSNITKAYYAFRETLIERELRLTSVSRINERKEGIRVSALENSGIRTLYHLSRLSSNQLYRIYGIGPDNVYKILNARDRIISSIRSKAKVRLNPDQRSRESSQLVRELYIYIKNTPFLNLLKNVEKDFLPSWKMTYSESNKLKNFVMWFIWSYKQKKSILNDAEAMINLTRSPEFLQTQSTVKIIKNHLNANDKDIWNDFNLNAADYYSILEKIIGSSTFLPPNENEVTLGVSPYAGSLDGFDYHQQKRNQLNQIPNDFTGESEHFLSKETIHEIEKIEVNLTGFKSNLRLYQLFGVKFSIYQPKVLIGDEMGLGKTVEAIAVLTHLSNENLNKFLVIVPASVLINWSREIEKHSSLKPIILHSKGFTINFASWQQFGGVAITTYHFAKKINELGLNSIDAVVIDEAHFVKNPNANRTLETKRIIEKSPRVLLLTGTPLENNLYEMNLLVGLVNQDLGKSLSQDIWFFKPEIYRHKIAHHYLRRNRNDVLKELPDIEQIEEWTSFNEDEKKAYKVAVESESFMLMRRIAYITSKGESSKIKRLIEICKEAKSNGRKVVIFSYFLEVIDIIKELLGDDAVLPITGEVKSEDRLKIIDEFTNNTKKHYLISQVSAGGVGLNIQAASVVILTEPQLKPSTEVQAIARSYRMGQVRDVLVYRLLTENSIDSSLMELLNHKQILFDAYAKESYLADNSLEAKDLSEKEIINSILKKEKEKLN